MKKPLLLLAALAATMGALAGEWQQPSFSGAFQPLTAGDTVYIYNPEAKLFLTEGNDWGTHATVGAAGLRFCVQPCVADGGEWDGQTYYIYDESVKKGGWYRMFITDGGHVYMDNATQADSLWQFIPQAGNTYQIKGAETNPVWTASGEMDGYLLGRYTEYENSRDGILTGTGVIYDFYGEDDYYEEGQFQTTWAFVSQADYEAYGVQVKTYEAAIGLGKQIAEAEAMGVTGLDAEKAVYDNTSSTLEEITAAAASTEKKVLAYYEVSVTPETPVIIDADECNSIDGWTNGINASTWNTQTWIDGSWTGFEGTTLNIWSGSLQGKAYKEFTGMPNGIYVVSLAAYAEKMDGYVYANENKKSVAGGAAGAVYQVTTEVTDGILQYGFGQDESGTNWVALDNADVKYYGQGVEAYRFWLNTLLESAPSFDDAIAMDSLVDAYNAVLASVKTVETKDEILGIIPAYEAILNEIDLNIAAYTNLITVSAAADEMATIEGINTYYGENLSDFTTEEVAPILEEHTMGTEAVNAVATQLQALIDEAQQYLWNCESLTSEVETAAGIYDEYKDQCAQEAADAYLNWLETYGQTNFDEYTADAVKTLLDELYDIEFNLQVPVDPASDENPVDYTSKIQYPSFDGGAEGWTNDGWSTCGTNSWNPTDGEVLDAQYLNLWNEGNAHVYQVITGLPAGAYVLQMSAYADAEGFQVYANKEYMDVLVGTAGSNHTNENGTAYIYSNTAEAEPFDGTVWYGNIYRIATVVGEDGTLEIGARNTNGGALWAMIDKAKLTYYGNGSAIVTEIAEVSTPAKSNIAAIYTVTGAKIPTLQRGINIVKMQNGNVRKVLVK